MRLRTIVNTLLFTALLCLWAPLRASGQQHKDSTWLDKLGNVRSRADLDKILDAHKQWVESQFVGSQGKLGARADLSGINLSYAELDGLNLWGANFEGTILIGAKLRGAILGPLGQKNQQQSTVLGGWRPSPPAMLSVSVCCDENGQPIGTSDSTVTDLRGALLSKAYLNGADVSYADCTGAALDGADLSHANLTGANLKGAYLIDTDLDTSDLQGANLLGATFEARSVSKIKGIASTANLESVTYRDNPGPLIELRKQFQDAGYREQERKITYALNREEARRDSFVERWFKRVAFDLTCQVRPDTWAATAHCLVALDVLLLCLCWCSCTSRVPRGFISSAAACGGENQTLRESKSSHSLSARRKGGSIPFPGSGGSGACCAPPCSLA